MDYWRFDFCRSSKQYTMTIKNLRMATKYSFHVKPQTRPGDQKASGRSEHDEDEFDGNSINLGQTVIIPTKGCEYIHCEKLTNVSRFSLPI